MSFGVVSSGPHPRLTLPEDVPRVLLQRSSKPEEWHGVVREIPDGWEIRAADLAADGLTGKTHVRMRSLTDRLLGLARAQGWTGLHHVGLENALITAVACAEGDLRFLFSFDLGEAESSLFAELGALGAVLNGCQLFTVPCRKDLQTVERILSPACSGLVVPPAIEIEPLQQSDVVESRVGAWGVHGRESGLPTVLKLAPGADRDLLLLGGYEAAEMYEFSTAMDRHAWSEKIDRPGHLSEEECLRRLLGCERSVFPLQTSAQAVYPLKALLAGARALVSDVSLMSDVDGLQPVKADWEKRLREPWSAPREGWEESFSPTRVKRCWQEAYQRCT